MLPPHRFYYLHNFQRALDWIGERYADLLDVREQGFLTGFSALPQQSQALLVRMLMRRGPWFRADKLVYEEIPDIAAAAGPLALVQDGDMIEVDVAARKLHLDVSDAELERRRAAWTAPHQR